MAWSGSRTPRPLTLALRFVNNDHVIAEITFSTAHEHRDVLPWSQATVCGTPVRVSPREPWLKQQRLHWNDIMTVLYKVI